MKNIIEVNVPPNFIHEIIDGDIKSNKYNGSVHTRFPPEPNGYLHIGHAKSICLNFGTALKYNGLCNLRLDDTNPTKEDVEYVDSIKQDVRWLGFDWEDREYFASDYFGAIYECAVKLIKKGKAYVCDLSAEEIKQFRGNLTETGKESTFRNRCIEENLDLFEKMKNGEFADGSRTLRAKIDMNSPNIHMRDPVIYRIMKTSHHRSGDKWCIYPMYDFAHCISDSIEKITHSICTLEFEIHRPLYDWFLIELEMYRPQQIEFARLNLTNTVMSKRKLLQLVGEKLVSGWDDPRMPTIAGMRRRGFTPESIRNFCETIGVTKYNSLTEMALLEFCVRENLNKKAPRAMGVLKPLRLVIENYPDGQVEEMDAVNNPEDPGAGTRKIPFSKILYIEQDDFRENPPKDYFRMSIGKEVRLRYGYIVKCTDLTKDSNGEVIEVKCTCDPATRGGNTPDGRKIKGTIHWVSAEHAIDAEVRLYDRLLSVENASDEEGDFKKFLNPDSLKIIRNCKLEPSLGNVPDGNRFQLERLGYFSIDPDSRPGKPVLNRIVQLKDSWSKIEKSQKK